MVPLSDPAVASMCHVMVETMSTPAVIYDEGCIVYVNPALQRLLKAPRIEDVVGRPVLDFVHADARDAAIERMRLVRENGAHLTHVKNRLLLCDGSELPVSLCAFPIMFGDVRLVGVLIEDWSGR